ncbi:MAG: YlbF family regulator [Clostridiales bacterium]|nr:YlbF family regulator [Clostridiales bacterium]
MREVMMKAQALAEAIVETGMYQKMQELEQQVTADPEATAAIADFVEKRNAFEALLQNPETAKGEFAVAGQAYAAAQSRLDECELVVALRKAQQEYNDLMENVNRILRLVVTGETEEGGCSGNCASCSGCH